MPHRVPLICLSLYLSTWTFGDPIPPVDQFNGDVGSKTPATTNTTSLALQPYSIVDLVPPLINATGTSLGWPPELANKCSKEFQSTVQKANAATQNRMLVLADFKSSIRRLMASYGGDTTDKSHWDGISHFITLDIIEAVSDAEVADTKKTIMTQFDRTVSNILPGLKQRLIDSVQEKYRFECEEKIASELEHWKVFNHDRFAILCGDYLYPGGKRVLSDKKVQSVREAIDGITIDLGQPDVMMEKGSEFYNRRIDSILTVLSNEIFWEFALAQSAKWLDFDQFWGHTSFIAVSQSGDWPVRVILVPNERLNRELGWNEKK